MTPIERALALARGDIAPPDMVKSGGAPAGFQPVPGGKHGGYRKNVGGKWQYWYPDAAAVGQAREHHAKEAHRHAVAHEQAGDTAARNEHHTAQGHHNEVASTLRDHEFAAERLPGAKGPRPGSLGANAHARMVEDHARVQVGGAPEPGPDRGATAKVGEVYQPEGWEPRARVTTEKSQGADMNRIAFALAIARGEVSPAAADARLQKSRAAAEEDAEDALVKAATSGQPPSGYTAVPGGAHGGFRKKTAKGYTYWYPDTTSAEAAVGHHTTEGKAARKRASDHEYRGMVMRQASGYSERDRELSAAKDHETSAAGAAAFVGKQTATRRIMDQHAADKTAAAEAAAMPTSAGEGKHYITHGKAGKKAVDTVARHGLYAVHRGEDARTGKPVHVVTHTPTGMMVSQGSKASAAATAKHFDAHAGDAGAGSKFGETPKGSDWDRLVAAHGAQARKSFDDWSPTMFAPVGESALVKSFTGTAHADRGVVREDAFKGVAEPALRKGGGDVALRGVGSGFDARWNDGYGVGARK